MSDTRIDVELGLNTAGAKKNAADARQGVKAVGDEAKASNRQLKDQEGLLERLRRRQREIREAAEKSTSVFSIAKHNAELQLFEKEVTRLTRIGRQGFDDMGNAIPDFNRPRGQVERLTVALGLYKRAVMEATTTEQMTKYNAKIEQTQAEIKRLTNMGKSGFDEMGNAIQKNIVWNNGLIRGLSRTVEHFRRLAYIIPGLGLTGLFMLAWGPLSKYVKKLWEARKVVDELVESQKNLNEARLKGSQSAQQELTSLQQLYRASKNTNLSVQERHKAVDALQKQYPGYFGNLTRETIMAGNATDAYKRLTNAILATAHAKAYQDRISENAGKQLENIDQMVELQAKFNKANEEYERRQKRMQDMDPLGNPLGYDNLVAQASAAKAARDAIGRQINDLGATNGRLERENKRFVNTIDQIVSKNGVGVLTGGFKGGADSDRVPKEIINRRRSLLDRIDALNAEHLRKVLDAEESEIQAIRDKFAKIRLEVERFNSSVANPSLRIDIDPLNELEDAVVSDKIFQQETEKIARSYEERKALFDNYQAYLKEAGKEAADKRFSNDLDSVKNFYSGLNDEIAALQGKQLEVGLSGSETDRLNKLLLILRKYNEERQAEDDRFFLDALKSYQTYENQRKKIIEDSEKAIAKLVSANRLDEADEARRQRDEALKKLLQDEIESNADYKRAMEIIERSSDAMLVTAFENGRGVVMRLIDGIKGATDQQRAELRKIFGDFFEKGIGNAKSDKMAEIANMSKGFGTLVESSLEFASNIDDGWQSLTSMVSTAGQLADMFGKMFDSPKLKDLGSGLGIFGAVLGVGGAISNYFNQRRESENSKIQQQIEYNNERQIKSTEAITKLIERQIQLINDLYGTERIERYLEVLGTLDEDFEKTNSRLQGRFKMTGDAFTDSILTRLNNGETRKQIQDSFKKFSADWMSAEKILSDRNLRSLKTWDSLKNGIEGSREELIKLRLEAESGAADDGTLRLIDQLEARIDAYTDAINRMNQELTGVSFSGLTDGLIDMFSNGKTSVDDFTEYFEKQMQAAIIRGFARDTVQKGMQEWYEWFAELSKDGLTDDDIRLLKEGGKWNGKEYKGYNQLTNEGKQAWDDMQKVTGIDFGDNTSGGMSGRIQSITQDQADVLAGQVMGIHLAVVRGQEMRQKAYDLLGHGIGHLRDILLVQYEIANNTKRTANNTNRLEKIEGYLEKISKGNNNSMRAGGN